MELEEKIKSIPMFFYYEHGIRHYQRVPNGLIVSTRSSLDYMSSVFVPIEDDYFHPPRLEDDKDV